MIRRPPRSTQSRSSAASDVYKRQAASSRNLLPGLSVGAPQAVLAGAELTLHPVQDHPERGALYGYTHLVAGLAAPQLELRPGAAEAQRHRHLLPGGREMRVDEQRLVAALQAGEAHHRGLPEAAHGGHVP